MHHWTEIFSQGDPDSYLTGVVSTSGWLVFRVVLTLVLDLSCMNQKISFRGTKKRLKQEN